MSRYHDQPLVPRNGKFLVVGIVARISGCQNQKELSLEDQVDHAKQEVQSLYDGPVSYKTVCTKGKGERLDRAELDDIEQMIRSRELDLLIAEDLGRIVRGIEAAKLLGIAVDHGTRVISPNDYIDTSEPTWEEDALSACKDHVSHNSHTSKRLKHKLMNRFEKFGGAIAREIFGYIVPDTAKTYDEWQKDPAAEAPIRGGFAELSRTLNYSSTAAWFNARGTPVGPYCRRRTWTGEMVRRLYRNPLLKGKPGRGFKHTVKHHETGRRISMPNPKGPKYRDYPQLAYFSAEELDDLNARLAVANRKYGRKKIDGVDPRLNVPRKRTRFPGQHARCWYCGRSFVWGGNGAKGSLMCSGARQWRCWNPIAFDGALAAQKLMKLVVDGLKGLRGFEQQFTGMLTAARQGSVDAPEKWANLIHGEREVAREEENLLSAIAQFGPRPMLQAKLCEIEDRQKALRLERQRLESLQNRQLAIPSSLPEIWENLEAEFGRLAIESIEFGDLLRPIVPEFCVYLVRLCDGGGLVPRARIRLNLAGSIPDIEQVPALQEFFSRTWTIDLFEPVQRAVLRLDAVRLVGNGLTYKEAAARLPISATSTAVGYAVALHRKMEELSLTDPYVLVTEPPADLKKLKRHRNPKYQFEPLPGYQPPTL